MKRLLSAVAMLVVGACGQTQPAPRPYGASLPPLTANGLPGSYELCARNAAVKTAAIYDVYYPCQPKIIQYVSQVGGKTQQEKAAMVDDMDKRALDYAQQQAEAFHGADAVRQASAPVSGAGPTAPSEWETCATRSIASGYRNGLEVDKTLQIAKAFCGRYTTAANVDQALADISTKVRASPPQVPEDVRAWARCSLEAIMAAYQAGLEAEMIISRARGTCSHLWDAPSDVKERLYGKMLASVRKGSDPGYTVGPSSPAAGEIRM